MDKNEIVVELENTLAAVNTTIRNITRYAMDHGLNAHNMRNSDGSWTLTPLLAAKVSALSALARLQANDG